MVCRSAFTAATPVVYTRDQLLHLRSTATSTLDYDVYNRIDSVSAGPVRSARGCRAGRQRCPQPQYTRCVGSGISRITGNRPAPHTQFASDDRTAFDNPSDTSPPCLSDNKPQIATVNQPVPHPSSHPHPSLLQVHINRRPAPPDRQLVLGTLNIRSIANKVDDLVEVRRAQKIDVLFLVETWHDSDSVSLRRLRAEGFQIVDRPRPRTRTNTIATNHGGVAVIAVPGLHLTLLDLGVKPTTFEFLCVRVATGTSSCIVATIYRPGSAAVSSVFFVETMDVADQLATFVEPVYIVGNINIRLELLTDTSTCQLTDVLGAHSFVNRVTTATHDRDGFLDIVAMRDDMQLPHVDMIDVGLSDHRLFHWLAPLVHPCPVYSSNLSAMETARNNSLS